MSYQTLAVEARQAHVLLVTLNRPKALNALNTQMGRELHELWTRLTAEPGEVRCVVLTGSGERAFCAGADLKELGSGTDYFPWAGSDEGPLRGWRSIHVTDGEHPYMGKWWVPGLAVGYETSFVHQVADFLDGLAKGRPAGPTFRDALETQKICDAVLTSAKSGAWTKVG